MSKYHGKATVKATVKKLYLICNLCCKQKNFNLTSLFAILAEKMK